jgi:hypothetical protein
MIIIIIIYYARPGRPYARIDDGSANTITATIGISEASDIKSNRENKF